MTQTYAAQRSREGAANSTINRELAVYSHIGNTLVEHGFLREPFPKPKSQKEENTRCIVIPDDDFRKILIAAKEDHCSYMYAFLVIARNTSMRHEEMLRLRFEHVDFDRREIFIPEAKAGARYQPISEEGLAAIRSLQAERGVESGWLFPSDTSASGHITYAKSQWKRILERAGLAHKGYTIHTIRHTVVTELAKQNLSTAMIKKISGHKSDAMVNRYTHMQNDAVTDALNSISLG